MADRGSTLPGMLQLAACGSRRGREQSIDWRVRPSAVGHRPDRRLPCRPGALLARFAEASCRSACPLPSLRAGCRKGWSLAPRAPRAPPAGRHGADCEISPRQAASRCRQWVADARPAKDWQVHAALRCCANAGGKKLVAGAQSNIAGKPSTGDILDSMNQKCGTKCGTRHGVLHTAPATRRDAHDAACRALPPFLRPAPLPLAAVAPWRPAPLPRYQPLTPAAAGLPAAVVLARLLA